MAEFTAEHIIATKTTRSHRIKITGNIILEYLKLQIPNIPDNAEVYFEVPSGGDWSGMKVDINDDNPVVVIFHESEEHVKI